MDGTPHILVVDDDPDMLALHELTLRAGGYASTLVESGQLALEQLSRWRPDAVILDINMPEMDGFEVLARVRETYSMAELPVVMVTGRVEPRFMVDALGSGANDYVLKGAPRQVLLAKLGIQLELLRQASAPSSRPAAASSAPAGAAFCGQCLTLVENGAPQCVGCRTPRPAPGWPAVAGSAYPWLGVTLGGKYLLDSFLGRGIAAQVYRARHTQLDRLLAVKLVDFRTSEFASLVNRERLEAEALAMARIESPHVVKIVEVLELRHGVFALIMDFVRGQTLRQLLGSNRPSYDDTLDLSIQIARGLAAAHSVGLIHRDVKPANVMISELQGGGLFAHLVDFGIVRPAAGDPVSTRFVVGTPTYMSPEQACGLDAVDGRMDQYSLGCLMYEMICGRPPFDDDDPNVVLRRQVLERPAPMSRHRAGVPESLERMVFRMLAKPPDDRFPTLELFLREALAVRATL
jgi:CheY-like chemotaxis protein/tRNA A-37 threonylcarbamoyl transferase component Bud32